MYVAGAVRRKLQLVDVDVVAVREDLVVGLLLVLQFEAMPLQLLADQLQIALLLP